jgi:hypothetical protein
MRKVAFNIPRLPDTVLLTLEDDDTVWQGIAYAREQLVH